jgi:hypothetical protein
MVVFDAVLGVDCLDSVFESENGAHQVSQNRDWEPMVLLANMNVQPSRFMSANSVLSGKNFADSRYLFKG